MFKGYGVFNIIYVMGKLVYVYEWIINWNFFNFNNDVKICIICCYLNFWVYFVDLIFVWI